MDLKSKMEVGEAMYFYNGSSMCSMSLYNSCAHLDLIESIIIV
jgi:hypothetical protein